MLNQQAERILWDLPDPVMVIKSDLEVEYVNSAFLGMLGIPFKNATDKNAHDIGLHHGKTWEDLIKNLELPGCQEKQEPTYTKKSEEINDPLLPKNSFGPYQNRPKVVLNDKIYFYEVFSVLPPAEQNSLSAIVFREITEDIELNDQMVQAEKMSGLGTLAAGLAHELNNPLFTIIGFAEMIIQEQNKEKTDEFARKILEKSKGLASTLDNLIKYIDLNPTDGHLTVNLNERLDAALEIALLTHESNTLEISRNYCSLPLLKAKPDEIQQIFFNIFCNAIEAMNGSGKLNITSQNLNDSINIKIEDTGNGVPKEYIAKVFDPFFTTKDQGEGTGLGLTAAYQLTKKYNGEIKLFSTQQKGTTVEISWPTN